MDSPLRSLVARLLSEEDRLVLSGGRPELSADDAGRVAGAFDRALERLRTAEKAPPVWRLSGLELLNRGRVVGGRVLARQLSEWLDRVWSMRAGAPAVGLDEARRARAAVSAVAEWLGEERARRLACRALALEGNAERIAGDLRAAEALLTESLALAEAPGEAAEARGLLVSVVVDAGRFEEARAMCPRVIAGWRAAGQLDRAAWARLQSARVLVELGEEIPAMRALLRIVRSRSATARLAAYAAHNAAELLARVGSFEDAAGVLADAEHLYAAVGAPLDRPRRWVFGRVVYGLGDLDRAERELDRVQAEYEAEGRVQEVALVGLDLCLIYAARSRWPEIVITARASAEALQRIGADPDAAAALWALRDAARRHTAEVVRLAAVTAAVVAARDRLRATK